jgi:hypothetical protein
MLNVAVTVPPRGTTWEEESGGMKRLIGVAALPFVDGSTGGSSLFGDIDRVQLVGDVVGDAKAARAGAVAAIARVEREVGHLWRDSMKADDRAMSHRLAEVSHALHRAARLLGHDDAIS